MNPGGGEEPSNLVSSEGAGERVAVGKEKPGFWAWIVIVLAPILMMAAEHLVPAAETETEAQTDLSVLALLQVNAKMVIALQGVDQTEAKKELRKLEAMAGSDEAVVAIAAIHGFLGLDEEGTEEVEQLIARRAAVDGVDRPFLEAGRQAVLKGVNETDRESLRLRIGWFADLLGVPGEPDQAPQGGQIRAESAAVLAVAGFGIIGGFLAILVGAGILLVALMMRGAGRLRLAFQAEHPGAGIYLESFAIFLGAMALGSVGGWFVHWSCQPVISLAGVGLALYWPKLHGVDWKRSCLGLGLHRGKGWLREIAAGFVGYLILLPMAVIGVACSFLLMRLAGSLPGQGMDRVVPSGEGAEAAVAPITHPAVGWLLGGWEIQLLVLFLAAVLAPLLEELFFRGAFFRFLRSRMGLMAAGLLSGLVFASLHPQGWMGIPALTAMGFGFAAIREWRDSLIAPMVAHAINNGLLIGGLSLILH